MFYTPETLFVINGHNEIVSLSGRLLVHVERNKKAITIPLPLIEHLELWMDMQLWYLAPVTREEFFEYLGIFHRAYVAELLR